MIKCSTIFLYKILGLVSIVLIQGCIAERKERGKEYLSGMTFSYSPFCEYMEIDQSGNIFHTLKVDKGKRIIFFKASEKEINEAKCRYPDLLRKAEAFQAAFGMSEIIFQSKMKSYRGKIDQFHFEWDKNIPPVPSHLQKEYEAWKLGWEKGSWYNSRRYREWYEKSPSPEDDGNSVNDLLSNNTKILEHPEYLLVKPQYDSGWLLYNPGEFKTLYHRLNVPQDQIFIQMSFKNMGNQMIAGYYDPVQYKGAWWSVLDFNRIRVQRLYKDELVECIRIRMWVIKK